MGKKHDKDGIMIIIAGGKKKSKMNKGGAGVALPKSIEEATKNMSDKELFQKSRELRRRNQIKASNKLLDILDERSDNTTRDKTSPLKEEKEVTSPKSRPRKMASTDARIGIQQENEVLKLMKKGMSEEEAIKIVLEKEGKQVNKGGAITKKVKRVKMAYGGMASGKKHMYAAAKGMVVDNPGLKALRASGPKGMEAYNKITGKT